MVTAATPSDSSTPLVTGTTPSEYKKIYGFSPPGTDGFYLGSRSLATRVLRTTRTRKLSHRQVPTRTLVSLTSMAPVRFSFPTCANHRLIEYSVESGNYPSWTVMFQVMTPADAEKYKCAILSEFQRNFTEDILFRQRLRSDQR